MTLLAISPCPNDTFAFYALLHGKTSWTDPLQTRFEDIQALNSLCFEGEVDFCKISFHAWLEVRDRYRLLRSGSALGFGCGPLVVARAGFDAAQLRTARIGIPGRFTTAALLLKLCLGENAALEEMRFDTIMPAVAEGRLDAGLIIHESRFTYGRYGLVSLMDLGAWWEGETGFPIPLGGIVASRNLPESQINAFENALAESVDYAFGHRAETVPFMQQHAREMEPEVMNQHVDLYVNDFTRDLGVEGGAAIDHLVTRYEALRGA